MLSFSGHPRRSGSLLHTLNAVSSRELSAARSPAQLCAGDAQVVTVNPGELTELSCPPCPLPKDDLTSQEPFPTGQVVRRLPGHTALCAARACITSFGLLRLWSFLCAGWQHCLGYCRPLIGKQQRLVCLLLAYLSWQFVSLFVSPQDQTILLKNKTKQQLSRSTQLAFAFILG